MAERKKVTKATIFKVASTFIANNPDKKAYVSKHENPDSAAYVWNALYRATDKGLKKIAKQISKV